MVSGKYFHQIEPVDVEEARRRKFRPVEKNRRRDGGSIRCPPIDKPFEIGRSRGEEHG